MPTEPTSTALPDPFSLSQPPPAQVSHTYTFSPDLAKYNIPLSQVLEENAPRDCIGVGAYVFRAHSNEETSSEGDSAVRDNQRELLLIRRSATERAFPKMFEVPGGGAEAPPIDATLLDSVARELFEETGLKAKRFVKFLDTADFEGRSGDKWRKFNFEVEVEDDTNVVLQPSEHDQFRWISSEDYVEQERLGESGWLGNTMPAQKATIKLAFGLDS